MKKKICYIVEDNKEDRDVLVSYIEKTSFLNLAGVATGYEEAVEFLFGNQVDILYLDIELASKNNLNGIDLIKTVAKLPQLIIVSNHSEYAVDSYNLGKTVDYLLKPYNYERFLIATNRAVSNTSITAAPSSMDTSVFFKVGRSFQKINLTEVLYFESFGIYVKVITDYTKRPEVVNETISSVLKYLNTTNFIRIHKLYIININKITGFDANHIFIDGKPLPIGISYKAKLENLLKLLTNLDDE